MSDLVGEIDIILHENKQLREQNRVLREALQARVKELEEWQQIVAGTQDRQDLIYRLSDHLTQRTAERDTARRRVDELEAREVDVVLLRDDLEQRTAELEAANKLLYKKNCELGRFETIISEAQAELERVRALIKALPKVEGEIVAQAGYVKDRKKVYACFGSVADMTAYAALLKHRQGMEG